MPYPLRQGLVRPEPAEVGGVRVESRRQRVHDAERAGNPQNVLERRTLAVLQALDRRDGKAGTVRHLRRRQATQLAPRPEVLAHLANGALDGCWRGARHPDRLLTRGLSMTIAYNGGFLHSKVA